MVHTGQHYDENLSDVFFHQMGIPAPPVNPEVGSGSHASQTAEILKRIEPVLEEHRPDVVVVVGDVNSTIALSPARRKPAKSLFSWDGQAAKRIVEILRRVAPGKKHPN